VVTEIFYSLKVLQVKRVVDSFASLVFVYHNTSVQTGGKVKALAYFSHHSREELGFPHLILCDLSRRFYGKIVIKIIAGVG
jgi:hypothetical protein